MRYSYFFLYIMCLLQGKDLVIIEAIVKGDVSGFNQLLVSVDSNRDNGGHILDERLDDESNSLHIACRMSDSDTSYMMLKALLSEGLCPNAGNKDLITPLHDVVFIKNKSRMMEAIEAFLVHGSRINQQDVRGETVLEKIVMLHDIHCLEIFLERFGYILSEEDLKRGMLFAGRKAGEGKGMTDHAHVLEMQIEKGNIKPKNMIEAVLKDDKVATKALSELEKDIKDAQFGMSPLMVAAKGERRAIMELLLGEKANVNAQDKEGKTVYHVIALSKCLDKAKKREYVRLIKAYGGKEELKDVRGRSGESLIEKIKK